MSIMNCYLAQTIGIIFFGYWLNKETNVFDKKIIRIGCGLVFGFYITTLLCTFLFYAPLFF